MELLQKALFNLPRAGGNQAPNPAERSPALDKLGLSHLDKLGLSHLYGAAQAHAAAVAAASAAANNPQAASAISQHQPPVAPSPLASPTPGVTPFGVEAVSPNIVYDVASLVLYGMSAIPVRLKILLDRLFSVLAQDDVIQILKGYGWTLEDYQRGYILKDNRGTPLERWQMCSKEEEPLVLQQFLRFGETRPITQQLILQELSERSNEEHRARVQSGIKKLMEHNSAAAAAAAAASAAAQAAALRPPPLTSPLINNNGHIGKPDRDSTSSPARSPHSKASPSVSPSSSTVVSPKGHGGMASPPATTPTSSVNGTGGLLPGSPVGSPLNKLQCMQPFDYRKSSEAKTPDSISSRGSIERPIPPSIPHGMPRMPGLGMPLIPNVSVPPSLASYHNSITKAQQEYQMSKIADENSHSALNLSSAPRNHSSSRNNESSRPIPSSRQSRQSTDKSEEAGPTGLSAEVRKKMRDNIGMSYISPTTGKKRVQCNVCLKTFCDKGALKIHFSAVHLREMHKCSVEGCNMMFSSRRSRNRHSANPNPKLHTPHLRRKISPHDGRTHQGPFLPSLAAFATTSKPPSMPNLPSPANFPGLSSPFGAPGAAASLLTPENMQNFQRQQMELQKLHELKMGMYAQGHQNFDAKRHHMELEENSESKRIRLSDSENENDEKESDKAESTKDEGASSGTQSATGGSKRKSRNPTRITNLNPAENPTEEDFSSDDDDEGFENPLDDIDDDMDLDHHDQDPDDQGASGASKPGSGNQPKPSKSPPPPGNNGSNSNADQQNHHDNNNGDSKPTDKEANNNADPEIFSDSENVPLEIPVDKENPKRCVECGQEFSNHFDVKHHYQNDHLGMMHKCTVEGCNAGFPSKRSRDRHASNLNLHRKLLSTTSVDTNTTNTSSTTQNQTNNSQSNFTNHVAQQSELLARLYTEQQLRNSLFNHDMEAKTKEFAAMMAFHHSSPEKFRHMMMTQATTS